MSGLQWPVGECKISWLFFLLAVFLCVISPADHGPAPTLDIPQVGGAEDLGLGKSYGQGFFYYIR